MIDRVAARTSPVAMIGAPSDTGAAVGGSSLGPEALRVAGLGRVLAGMGYRVADRGNLGGPVNPERPPEGGYRHLPEMATWCRLARDAVGDALAAAELPVLLGGDHALAIGSVAAVARHCAATRRPLAVLWLDAHADFNTADTSPSGNLQGMPLAVLCGQGPAELLDVGGDTPVLDPDRVALIGARSVDTAEKPRVAEHGLRIYDMRRIDEEGMRAVVAAALAEVAAEGAHLHVSFDLDFADPEIAPGVSVPVPGGISYREAQLCMEMIHDSGLLGSVDIVELNPARDVRNRTAELAVELVASLFGERILARTP